MKVKELIEMLQKCNQNADIIIDDFHAVGLVWDCPTTGKVNITTEPTEEAIDDMERDEFFNALADEVDQGMGEILDSLKINGVQ